MIRYRSPVGRSAFWLVIAFVSVLSFFATPLSASSVVISWQSNSETDLAGYKLYYGTISRLYSYIRNCGEVTQVQVDSLAAGVTYFFSVTAYDSHGNESSYSEEAVITVSDTDPPRVLAASCQMVDRIALTFDEPVQETSAENPANYTINNDIVVQRAELQTNLRTVYLYTTLHSNGTYSVTTNQVLDRAAVPNGMTSPSVLSYTWGGNDEIPPQVVNVELYRTDFVAITFSEPLDQTSALLVSNYTIFPPVTVLNSAIDGLFTKVYLTTNTHTPGVSYTLTMNNLKDGAIPANTISTNTQTYYLCRSEDSDPPVLIAVRLVTPTQLQLEFSEGLDSTSALTIGHYGISPSVAISGASFQDNRTQVLLTTSAHAAGNYSVSASGVTDDAVPPNTIEDTQLNYSYVAPDLTPPTMSAVALLGDDWLQVTFSEPLEETSAEDPGHYAIDPAKGILSATLDVSQKIVLLQTQSHEGGSYRLIVNNVHDMAQNPNTIAPNSALSYSYTPPDRTPPEILETRLHGSDMIELVFSEPIDRTSAENKSHYLISPSVEVLTATLTGATYNTVYLKTRDHQQGQTYTLAVSNILDRAPAPNVLDAGTATVYEYPLIDTTPPRLSAAVLQGNRFVKLTFSESLDPVSAGSVALYTISPYVRIEEAVLDASGTQVYLRTEPHAAGFSYTVTVQDVFDRASPSNAIGSDNQRVYVCTSSDTEPPRLAQAELHGDQILEIAFSEPVETTTALDPTNYSIDKGIAVQGVSLSQSRTEVFLTTSPHPQGTYTVTVENVRDMAEIPNTIAEGSHLPYVYVPPDTTPPRLVDVLLFNANTVELNFSEVLFRESAEDVSHYMISNGIVVQRAILDVSMTRVFLQTSTHSPGPYSVTIHGVEDGSGVRNVIAPNTVAYYTLVVEDNTPPVIVDASLITERMLAVRFSESLDRETAGNPDHYVINQNIAIQAVAVAASDDQVILETSPHAAGEYILTVNDIKDSSPQKNAVASYSQIRYVWNPPDTVGPSLTSVDLLTSTYLKLDFDEPINSIDAQNKSHYTIDPPIEVVNAVLDVSLTKVWLYTAAHNPGSYTITVTGIRDRAFVPNTVGSHNQADYRYTPPDISAPVLVSVQLRTPMCLALVFDEPLSRASVEDTAHFSISPDIEVKSVYLLASLTTIHLETSPHQAGIPYRVTIRGLEDRAPIPNVLDSPIVADYTYTPPDTSAPRLLAAKLLGVNLLELTFSEAVEQQSAETRDNYRIDPSVEVLSASLDTSVLTRVYLETTSHSPGVGYSVNARNVVDRAPIPNVINPGTWVDYSLPGSGSLSDNTPPQIARIDILSTTQIDVVFSEIVERTSAENKVNYTIVPSLTVQSAVLDSQGVRVHMTTSSHQGGISYALSVANVKDRAGSPNVMAGPSAVRYIMDRGLYVSGLNKAAYKLGIFQKGDTSYVDRSYTLTQAPDVLTGSVQILTSNEDKTSTGNSFLSFDVRGDATLYVAFDQRIPAVPTWLSEWSSSGLQVVDSRSGVYGLYSSEVHTGRVALGGNGGTSDDAMYLVFLVPHISNETALADLSKPSYQVDHVDVGEMYYIDRDYTITTIPDTLKDLLWIKTANDDKMSREERFLTFTLTQKSLVYVASDSRMATLPRWLIDWTGMEGQIVDSRGSRFDVRCRTFEAGEVVLGGNGGSSDDNMYLILVEPLGISDSDRSDCPGYFSIFQNYPNPFNPHTTIRYHVDKTGRVMISVFNVLGQRVRVLVDRDIEAGTDTQVVWDGSDERGLPVASGMYFYRIQQSHYAKTRRMILMR